MTAAPAFSALLDRGRPQFTQKASIKTPCGGEPSRERAELRKEINNALAGVNTRVIDLEQGLEQQGTRTLQAVGTMNTFQAEQRLPVQRIQDDIGARMTTLENKMRTMQSARSTPSTPALVIWGLASRHWHPRYSNTRLTARFES